MRAAALLGCLRALLLAAPSNAASSFETSLVFGTQKEVEGLLGDVWAITDVQAAAMGDNLLYNASQGGVDAAAMRRLLFAQQKAADSSVFMM